MNPERWQQIRDLLEQALELAPEQRAALLDRSCVSDPSLRQEVEVLLAASDDVRSSFLQSSITQGITLTPITSCPSSLNTRLTHGECIPVSNAIRQCGVQLGNLQHPVGDWPSHPICFRHLTSCSPVNQE